MKPIGKFLLFLVLSFLGAVVMIFILGILYGLFNLSFDSFEIVSAILSYVALGITYWLFYGESQLARYRHKRAREIELGLEKSPIIKKKTLIRIIIIISTFVIGSLISKIFNISTENTWLGLIVVDIVFITAGLMIYDKLKSLQGPQYDQPVGCLLRFIIFVGAAAILISNIVFIFIFFLNR